jgi:hypothetical protein
MPTLRVVVDGYYVPLDIEPYTDDTYKLTFRYNKKLIEEIKNFEGARWNPDSKFWTIKKSQRNRFTLQYLCGKNPYERWKKDIIHYEPNRDTLMKHQDHMKDVILNKRRVIIAGEPGVGKTLAAIEALELAEVQEVLWAAPNSALQAVKLEFMKWGSKIYPRFITYDSLKKYVREWPDGKKAPQVFVGDEAHKLKSPTTQRYEAASHIVNSMLEEYDDPYVILMTGSPAPRDPTDWWAQVELICPGFIKEPNIKKFKQRLALVKDNQSLAGGWFPRTITYFDNERKCRSCGQFEDHLNHSPDGMVLGYDFHSYEKSVNEVEYLYKRLGGIVDITFKKDVLKELPDKNYRIIRCTPSPETLRAAQLITATARNAITAATLLRELSDGFQYKQIEVGMSVCELCHGKKTIIAPKGLPFDDCPSCGEKILDFKCIGCQMEFERPNDQDNEEIDCPHCDGSGEVPRCVKEAIQVPCEKEQVLKDILDEYEETGRSVIYAGFQGSVDRCIKICKEMEWETVKVDGRGWVSSYEKLNSPVRMLQSFQDKSRDIPKLAFIGQPDAGGLGLTLTESCHEFFYSNSFNAASKQQAMDRIHRPGMDINKGATIIECFNLPTDEAVYDNLMKKKKLQDMTLGQFSEALKK